MKTDERIDTEVETLLRTKPDRVGKTSIFVEQPPEPRTTKATVKQLLVDELDEDEAMLVADGIMEKPQTYKYGLYKNMKTGKLVHLHKGRKTTYELDEGKMQSHPIFKLKTPIVAYFGDGYFADKAMKKYTFIGEVIYDEKHEEVSLEGTPKDTEAVQV